MVKETTFLTLINSLYVPLVPPSSHQDQSSVISVLHLIVPGTEVSQHLGILNVFTLATSCDSVVILLAGVSKLQPTHVPVPILPVTRLWHLDIKENTRMGRLVVDLVCTKTQVQQSFFHRGPPPLHPVLTTPGWEGVHTSWYRSTQFLFDSHLGNQISLGFKSLPWSANPSMVQAVPE